MRIPVVLALLVLFSAVGAQVSVDDTSILPDPGIVPDSRLYRFDVFVEKIEVFIARDKMAKRAEIAKEKLAEAYELASEGNSQYYIVAALDRHDDLLFEIEDEMASATGSIEIYAKSLYMNETLKRHMKAIATLENILATKCKDRSCSQGLTSAIDVVTNRAKTSRQKAEQRIKRANNVAVQYGKTMPELMREELTRQAREKIDNVEANEKRNEKEPGRR